MLYNKILKKYNEIKNLEYSLGLLNWDQCTYIPVKGHETRSEIIETISKITHEMLISDEFYDLINQFKNNNDNNEIKEIQIEEIDKIKHEVELSRKIPADLASKIAKTTSMAMAIWQDAKKNNDDKEYLPYLKEIINLKKEEATCLGYDDNIYDALLDQYDRGLKYNYLKPLFQKLENELINIINKIKNSNNKINDDFLFNNYNTDKQWQYGYKILKEIGIDFNSFRQDTSAHPFTTTLGKNDTRITTDITENNFQKGFFSTIHEGGHALYELNVNRILKHSPFSHINSLSMHESQSRFYENIIARNYKFWICHYEELQKTFPENLKNITIDNFYKAINKVEITPIRVEADEVTYNLHILLRTELEYALMNDQIKIDDIDQYWNEKTEKIFGFRPQTKKEGYLQDIHWSDGLLGYFPTYTLGNLIASQVFNTMKNDLGDFDKIDDKLLTSIYNWFNDNLYSLGSRYTSTESIMKLTNEELNADYFINYIKEKYNSIYS